MNLQPELLCPNLSFLLIEYAYDSHMALSKQAVTLDHAKISRAWRAFMAYRSLSLQVFDSQAAAYERMPPQIQALISNFPIRLSHAAEAIEHNADIVERIARLAGIDDLFDPATLTEGQLAQTVTDFPDVVDGLLTIVTDWSADGDKDRGVIYAPVLRAVEEAAGDAVASGSVEAKEAYTVLVLGAGLGRLSWEVARRGFSVQGVESSYALLFLCNYVLNGQASVEKPLHLYPFAHHTGMVHTVNEQCKEVQFPDVNPRETNNSNFGMVAGEFLELYDEEESWDCIVTCFYIENSHSIISYVRRIAKVLRAGGVWINQGGLDYRFEGSVIEPCIEVTAEELDLVMVRTGLRVVKREHLRCKPPFSVDGMIDESIDTCFSVAVKI